MAAKPLKIKNLTAVQYGKARREAYLAPQIYHRPSRVLAESQSVHDRKANIVTTQPDPVFTVRVLLQVTQLHKGRHVTMSRGTAKSRLISNLSNAKQRMLRREARKDRESLLHR